eukprot:gene21792-biopygen8682
MGNRKECDAQAPPEKTNMGEADNTVPLAASSTVGMHAVGGIKRDREQQRDKKHRIDWHCFVMWQISSDALQGRFFTNATVRGAAPAAAVPQAWV